MSGTAVDTPEKAGWEWRGGLLLQLRRITQASEPHFAPVPRKSGLEKLTLLAVVLLCTPLHGSEREKPDYPRLKTKSKVALELSQVANGILGSSAKQNCVEQGSV